MIIDVHAHLYPESYLAMIGRPEIPPRRAAALADQSLEQRLELMDRAGVTAQVLSVAQAQPYLASDEASVAAAVAVNDIYAGVVGEFPGRFYAFGALPMTVPGAAVVEAGRVFEELGMLGVTVGCSVAGRALDDELFAPVFAELDRREAVVFLHPIGDAFVCGMGDFGLDWLIGAPIEDSVAAMRLVLSGMAERYAGIQWIVPHLGGVFPFMWGRVTRTTGGRLEALRRMWFDTVAGAEAAFACTTAALGSERLLYGTDYPYADERGFLRRLSYLDEQGWSEQEVREIKGERLARLLKLDLTADTAH
ncbi:amidohydrolase family protein [Rugosimonospora acidiphila]|uniref:Amidohydrolase family protein n=1 Tax=Rugosimonospora acidiphila TaxID=556531 RepID=A0ABP9S1I8_9ACTN